MKKILFATTALVATAGVASAEVALTGLAEMGVFGGNEADTQFFTDLDVTFTMTGEADNGLTFGATIDLDEAADRGEPGRFESPNTQGGENMFISWGGMTFTMGDTDGAFDRILPEMALAGGSLADDETIHAGFQHADGSDGNFSILALDDFFTAQSARAIAAGNLAATEAAFAALASPSVNDLLNLENVRALDAAALEEANAAAQDIGFDDLADYMDTFAGASADEIEAVLAIGIAGYGLDGFGDGQVARFDYAYDAFSFSLSAEQVADGNDVDDIGDTVWGVGGAWSGAVSTVDLTVALGYQTLSDIASVTGLAVTGAVANGFSAGFDYSLTDLDDVDEDVTHWGVGFGYEVGALAVGVNWGMFEYDGEEQSGAGLAAAYDLGGGLAAKFGYGHSDYIIGDDVNTYSLGLAMSF
ncbi:hypothetical protein C357_10042 [Citreicella sp. 357]|nr:hypothetical protein C357_10042 [Citreicella sp. 357]